MNEFEKVEASALIETFEELTEAVEVNTAQKKRMELMETLILIMLVISLAVHQNQHKKEHERLDSIESTLNEIGKYKIEVYKITKIKEIEND